MKLEEEGADEIFLLSFCCCLEQQAVHL
jgi:hypothetical protein